MHRRIKGKFPQSGCESGGHKLGLIFIQILGLAFTMGPMPQHHGNQDSMEAILACRPALTELGGNREVLQIESGSIFGKVRVRVLTGQGQSTHEHMRTESLFCKQKIDFRFHFRFGQFRRSDWGHSRKFWWKPCCSRVKK